MINNNKILTVSYGTFSCTLEGFDDSFGTMKAIAEYFRDLSADDRYFGAEPAQPDAQMLARIAEREISRHVEAREDRGRIVLSAQSAPDSAATDAVVDDSAELTDGPVPDQEPEATEAEPVQAPQPKLRKAKFVVKHTPPITKADHSDEGDEDAPVGAKAPAHVLSGKRAAEGAAERDIVPSLPDEDVEAFFAERTNAVEGKSNFQDDNFQDDVEDDIIPAQERAKADSIADKLKRIRAVVSQQGDATVAPDYSEDQHADATVVSAAKKLTRVVDDAQAEEDTDPSENVLANTLRDLEDALDADDDAETEYADDDAGYDDDEESDDDDIAAILSRLERETDTDDLDDEEEVEDDADGAYLDEDEEDDMDGNILTAMDTVEATVAEIELTDENLFEDEDDIEDELPKPEERVEAPAPAAPQPDRVAPRTRVLKVKRATLEAAIQSGQLEEYDEEEEAPAAPLRTLSNLTRSTLSAEAEEALARELAELEADMEAGLHAEFDEEEELEEEAAPAPRTRIRAAADEDFSRLMEESEQQMDEPEGATRRDAFTHLRAAVAAKKADEAVGGADEDEDTDEAYREDLASVVRPRRPSSGDRARTERPAEPRPAPLKLVAEQRIDTAEVKRVTPVRPRRVAAVAPQPVSQAHAASQAEDFADFADEMGATKLPDLLEAAAAYLSFVEGHENFSRPQLMTKVRQVEKENFTREDSLRSFGKLLREGKIEKMKGGRFQASDHIGFKPAKRAAG